VGACHRRRVGLYTRQQLILLLLLVGAAGLGLGVVHWRAANPEIVERLEQLEREIAASADVKGEERREGRVVEPSPPSQRERGEREARPLAPARAPKRLAPAPGDSAPPLDLNRATLADLTRLPGVGPVMARRILEARDDVGRFGAIDDLLNVRGLGRAKLERLRPFVGVDQTNMGGLATGPPSPPTLVAPRETRGAPRSTPRDTPRSPPDTPPDS
jgi:competence ComEA-like helix-hairpin-helix protein